MCLLCFLECCLQTSWIWVTRRICSNADSLGPDSRMGSRNLYFSQPPQRFSNEPQLWKALFMTKMQSWKSKDSNPISSIFSNGVRCFEFVCLIFLIGDRLINEHCEFSNTNDLYAKLGCGTLSFSPSPFSFLHHSLIQWFSVCNLRTAPSASPGYLLEMCVFGPHSSPSEPGTLGVWHTFQMILIHAKVEEPLI